MKFAAKMYTKLFNEETRFTHNVAGRGKPKLYPKITEYIKRKCFEIFLTNPMRTCKENGPNV